MSNIILDAIVEVSRYQSNTICRGPSTGIERHCFRTSFVGFNPEKKTQKQEQQIQPENTKYMHNNSSINTFSQNRRYFKQCAKMEGYLRTHGRKPENADATVTKTQNRPSHLKIRQSIWLSMICLREIECRECRERERESAETERDRVNAESLRDSFSL